MVLSGRLTTGHRIGKEICILLLRFQQSLSPIMEGRFLMAAGSASQCLAKTSSTITINALLHLFAHLHILKQVACHSCSLFYKILGI